MGGGGRAALVFGVAPLSVVFLLWFAFGWWSVKTKRNRRCAPRPIPGVPTGVPTSPRVPDTRARPRDRASLTQPRLSRPRRRRLESLLTRTSASGAVAGAVRGASAASGLASRRADPRADEAQLADAEAPDAEDDVDVCVDVVDASEADARDAAVVRTGDLPDDPTRRVRRVIGELDEMQRRYDAVFRAVAADDGTAKGTPTRL